MKINFLKSIALVLLTLLPFSYSCKNTEVLAPDDDIAGVYQTIINPLLCSLPTMSDLKITADGTSYNLTFKNTVTSSNEVLSNITVEKMDSTTKLAYKGAALGEFRSMKYLDFSNGGAQNVEGRVLMLRFDKENKHYEYMGRK